MKKERIVYDDTSFVTGFRGIAGNNGPHQYRGLVSTLNINHIHRYRSAYGLFHLCFKMKVLGTLWMIPVMREQDLCY